MAPERNKTWWFHHEQRIVSIILLTICTKPFVVQTANPSKIILDLTKPINSVISKTTSFDNFASTLESSGMLGGHNLDNLSPSLLYATGNYKSSIALLQL